MLKEVLMEVPYFRSKREQSYDLWAILGLIVVGFVCPPAGERNQHEIAMTRSDRQIFTPHSPMSQSI